MFSTRKKTDNANSLLNLGGNKVLRGRHRAAMFVLISRDSLNDRAMPSAETHAGLSH